MKFNWGTGILIFLILFLIACAVFITFAMRQDVNLVHKDYYEKGVDYTEQMHVNARSASLTDSIRVLISDDLLKMDFAASLVSKIDSGKVLLYRPSSSKMDITLPMIFAENCLDINKSNLKTGRYIIKLSWYSEGLKYEIDKAVIVP
jgi:hypothetical protein